VSSIVDHQNAFGSVDHVGDLGNPCAVQSPRRPTISRVVMAYTQRLLDSTCAITSWKASKTTAVEQIAFRFLRAPEDRPFPSRAKRP
jgi:hypothetical protein